ncbi:alpha/beta hydrolase [Vibrio sp. HA2012]|uniref:alpha/beta hydrolase n=1 Tax=Vibrio sp. HA2012 TaxID=1971595 RepID=UPI0018E22A52|nr:prolyl oligopeptidase family serine peptidase [Vibrio sp. HA2012]
MQFPMTDMVSPDEKFCLTTEGDANHLQGEWPNRYYTQVTRLELHYFRARKPARAQALVYGGGGYLELVYDKEGVEVALWLAEMGIDAYVVTHRLPGAEDNSGGVYPADIALQDGLACLDFIKGRSELPLLHVGLSSGGHLAGVMACQKNPLAAKGALIAYAPINANHRKYKSPVGKPDYPPAEKQNFYDAWAIGIQNEPHAIPSVPVFLVYALHDQSVPVDHALNMIKTAQENGGDVEAHIYPQAPHGFALRDTSGTHDQWPHLAARWIDNLLA